MIVKLDDVVNKISGNEDRFTTDLDYYLAGEHYESDRIAIYKKGILRDDLNLLGFKFHFPFKAGDTIFMSRNPHLKKAGMVTYDGICSDTSYILRTKDEAVLLERFLPLVLQNDRFWNWFEQNKSGSVNYLLNWKTLKEYEFELPSIEEQQRIADLAWAMERTRVAYEHMITATDELVKSQFIEMFYGKTNAQYITLEECCNSITGGSTPSMSHEEYYGGNVPFIKSGDVKSSRVSSGALWLTETALQNTTAKLIPEGTVIVVVRSGILKHTLPVAIATNPLVINQDIKAFHIKPQFTSQYIAWAIRSQEEALLRKTRVMTVDNIESKDLFEIPVMCASFEEQKKFEAFVEQTDKSKFELTQALEALNATYKKLISENLG